MTPTTPILAYGVGAVAAPVLDDDVAAATLPVEETAPELGPDVSRVPGLPDSVPEIEIGVESTRREVVVGLGWVTENVEPRSTTVEDSELGSATEDEEEEEEEEGRSWI